VICFHGVEVILGCFLDIKNGDADGDLFFVICFHGVEVIL
jgi:hypothetical protein